MVWAVRGAAQSALGVLDPGTVRHAPESTRSGSVIQGPSHTHQQAQNGATAENGEDDAERNRRLLLVG